VLLKYGALLSDPGQHGMLPLAVFGTLQEWGCEGEGFATPLNATLQSYCSLHSEADRCFGSLGSFFAAKAIFVKRGARGRMGFIWRAVKTLVRTDSLYIDFAYL